MFYIFVFCIIHTNMSKMKWGDNKQCSEIKSLESGEKNPGAEQRWTFTRIRGKIRCYGGVSSSADPAVSSSLYSKITEKSVDNSMINNGLRMCMKNVSQHLT